ncbi:hypothetical protein CA54_40630 [Symmachiella macrocystis]|uniref:Uncharacterized protein n=1 Tax=Symmachiella macrocystis TaxID=2527985 RepID=A0A5C6BC15_9PLAN|nr:hypothetical protein CA54_40630 [Symmachiella macrocystis]
MLHHNRSTSTLSSARPLPSILTQIPDGSKRLVKLVDVNYSPWLEFEIFGVLCSNASSKLLRQNVLSNLLDNCQLTIYRLNQSSTAS